MNTLEISCMDRHKKIIRLLIFSFAAMILSAALGICLGPQNVDLVEMVRAALSGDTGSTAYRILVHVRLPRVLGAILAGSALSVSGAIIQAVLNNPLASPNIIGVNTGAGLFVLLVSALFPVHSSLLPLSAFLGALLTCVIILAVSANSSRLILVLTGFAISSLFAAGMNAVMIFYPDAYMGASNFLVGGLSSLTMDNIKYPAAYIVAGLILALLCGKELNIISLGQDTAKSLGMQVKRSRFLLISVAAALAGAAVSFAGLIGFVGLVIPHTVKFLAGSDNKVTVLASIFLGSAFVTLCDLFARTAFSPYEVPVGILMACCGGPFFIILILRNKQKNHD